MSDSAFAPEVIGDNTDPISDGNEDPGLETEREDNENEKITDPFDPELIKIRTAPLLISQLVTRVEWHEIDLDPEFQRLRVWNSARQSRLIESLLLRIPIPVFYVAADEKETWTVVDGVQRMSTINDYVTGQFALSQLQYLTHLNGLRHTDLPRPMQRRIGETQLIVNIIEPSTPSEVMFNVFYRINTFGLPLTAQEIRNALYPGPIRGFLKNLAESTEFTKATDRSIRKTRMEDRECVLRFLAFFLINPEEYAVNNLDNFLVNAIEKINNMEASEREALAGCFKKAMKAAYDIFGTDAFRKRTHPGYSRQRVNRALFEAWSVQLARCSSEHVERLVRGKNDVQKGFIGLMNRDHEFVDSISLSTGTPRRVRKRFKAIQQLIEEFA